MDKEAIAVDNELNIEQEETAEINLEVNRQSIHGRYEDNLEADAASQEFVID